MKDAIKGYHCECCGSYIKEYHRSLNSNMALALIVLYNSGIQDYVHLENLLMERGYKRCGDFSYLSHYRFIERLSEKRSDGSSRNGMYKITSLGLMFSEGKITAKSKFIMRQNKLQGFEGNDIYIQQALGKKFNYDELIAPPKYNQPQLF